MSTPETPPLPEPVIALRKAVAFVDGQNLFHDAMRVFGYRFPNYDVAKLSAAVCAKLGWELAGVRFYTGVPSEKQNWRFKFFWDKKLFAMRHSGANIEPFPKKLKGRDVSIRLYGGLTVETPSTVDPDRYDPQPVDSPWVTKKGKGLEPGTVIGQEVFAEKGVDVSIAVDSIRFALEDRYDVCLFFSQDADLEPAVKEINAIAKMKGKTLLLASAFPSDGGGYGIPGTIHIRIDKAMYDSCIDPVD